MTPFVASRIDGRSDRQVIFDLVQDASPETLFLYDALKTVLENGTARRITRNIIGNAVRQAARNLLREKSRTLRVVANQGYRVVPATEHMELALARKDRAEVMIHRGIEILQGTRLDELDEPHRSLHQGQLLIMSGFYQALRSTRKRQDKQDLVIKSLTERVERLETTA